MLVLSISEVTVLKSSPDSYRGSYWRFLASTIYEKKKVVLYEDGLFFVSENGVFVKFYV